MKNKPMINVNKFINQQMRTIKCNKMISVLKLDK